MQRFLIDKFWNTVSCMVFDPTFGVEGQRLWDNHNDMNSS